MHSTINKLFQSGNKSALTAVFSLFAGVFIVFVSITAGWNYVSTTVFPNTTVGLYDRNFWENILVESHGLLLDILVLGVLVVWLELRRNNKQFIYRHKEDISDLAHLDTPEINMKKVGIIKRLNSINIYDIDVPNLVLTNAKAKGLKFKNSKLIGFKLSNGSLHSFSYEDSNLRSSDFSGSRILNTEFIRCNLYKTDFTNCQASGTDFTDSCLDRVKFIGANMTSANFRGSDLIGASFEGANLRNANFKDAKNLSIERLIKAECLDYIVIEEVLRNEVLRHRDEVKFSVRSADN